LPWALFESAGFAVAGADAAVEAPSDGDLARGRLAVVSTPMHTALKLSTPLVRRLRALSPAAHVCFHGLYAWLNAEHLLASGLADSVIGGEPEATLLDLARALVDGCELESVAGLTTRSSLEREGRIRPPVLARQRLAVPRRTGLPPLSRYAKLVGPAPNEERFVGYVEASRGCKHRCRHCPVVPVYDGRFFVLDADLVLADAEQQIAAGARHLTFGDADFFNGPTHAMAIARRLHEAHPDVSFDVTIKVEHILAHRELITELRLLGCAFVVSALESLSDRVLAELDKGHCRADMYEALAVVRSVGLTLRPSFVPFTPWSRLEDYLEIIDFIFSQGLVQAVDPIQLAIRLLVPRGSALLWPSAKRRPAGSAHDPAVSDMLRLAPRPAWLGPFDAELASYQWHYEDHRMLDVERRVSALVADHAAREEPPRRTLLAIRELAYGMADRLPPPLIEAEAAAFVPRLTEPWFCCAEPNSDQLRRAGALGCR
jgi:radical SAM superfamily enzyme YgiQ (UPF0313 family)